MTYDEWAARHPQAATELSEVFQPVPAPPGATSEAATSKRCELLSGKYRQRLWRNNSGAATDEQTGRLIRYGLGNTSARLNAVFKTGDYVGITTITVRPEHVGMQLGIFTMLEMKRPGWRLVPSDKRVQAQQAALTIVQQAGGIGAFITHPDQYVAILRKWGIIDSGGKPL